MSDKDLNDQVAVSEPNQPAEATDRKGWVSWLLGWVLIPVGLIGLIVGGGVLVGAHFHDSWFARSVVWLAERL